MGDHRTNRVILLTPRRPAAGIIHQRDLEEYFFLRRQQQEARRRFCQVRDRLKELLRRGAPIEPGIHTAELVPGRRGPRLLVR